MANGNRRQGVDTYDDEGYKIGMLKTIVPGKQFGFIRCKGIEYFFHQNEYLGDWDQLLKLSETQKDIKLGGRVVHTPKGPRLEDVSIHI